MSEVKRYLISYEKLREWFQESTKTNQSPWYEIAATNYIAQNAHLISGEPPVRVWVEMKLGSEEEGDASHPDVIFETKDRLFVVEVKYTDSETGSTRLHTFPCLCRAFSGSCYYCHYASQEKAQ
jgi:hypothetical protein